MRAAATAAQSGRYFSLLGDALFSSDPELALAGAAELGREFVMQGLLPEDFIAVHHAALRRLARQHPGLPLADVADGLMGPLMEVSMAYSLAFRRKREQSDAFKVHAAQAGRLEAIGTMAAGIAHDFNSILGVINGYAELLLDEIGAAPVARDYTEEVLAASLRARDLIVRILAFARQAPIAPVLIDAVEFVTDAIKMLRISLGSGIQLVLRTELARADMLADPMQIEQIVINLCMNGADAMAGNGKLVVDLVEAAPVLDAGGALLRRFCIAVVDEGCGMSPEVRLRALDPFFTTKAPGKGSGLGLSVVYGIVADLGGEMQICSAPGMGSSVHIFLPLKHLGYPLQHPDTES